MWIFISWFKLIQFSTLVNYCCIPVRWNDCVERHRYFIIRSSRIPSNFGFLSAELCNIQNARVGYVWPLFPIHVGPSDVERWQGRSFRKDRDRLDHVKSIMRSCLFAPTVYEPVFLFVSNILLCTSYTYLLSWVSKIKSIKDTSPLTKILLSILCFLFWKDTFVF